MAPYDAAQIDDFTNSLTRTYGIARGDGEIQILAKGINRIWKCTLIQEVQTLPGDDFLAMQGICYDVCMSARREHNLLRRKEILKDFFVWHGVDELVQSPRFSEYCLYKIARNRIELFRHRNRLSQIIAIRKRAHYFCWPTFTDLGGGGDTLGAWTQQSLLRVAGYLVGENADNDRERHRLLASFYQGHSRVEADVLAEYGAPSSANRLREMARRIASWIRLHSRQDNYRIATDHWRMDLGYLKVNFYDGVYDFDWPF
ncbi:MAG: hypothetical protein HY916_00925 [Desulfovibrio sp.]|jgi:hypothetical protein|nr:hypothetical protein [Desulfovibrio sp.]